MLLYLIQRPCVNGCPGLNSGLNSGSEPSLDKMGQAQGRELPFDIGDRHSCLTGKTIWSAHDGRRKVNKIYTFQ